MCFKITLAILWFCFSSNFSCSSQNTKRYLPGTVLYFYYFFLQITRIVSTELISCVIYCMFIIIYFGNLGYGFSLVISKL